MSPVPAGLPVTEPEFRNDAELLAAKMRRYTQEEIAVLLKISPKLARENYMRYQQFDAPDNPIKQALFAYNGSVFKHIQAGHLVWMIWSMLKTICGLSRPYMGCCVLWIGLRLIG